VSLRNRLFDERTVADFRNCHSSELEVGSFCCPVLPEPLDSPSVARWGPTAL
jgi:hypothetical protein